MKVFNIILKLITHFYLMLILGYYTYVNIFVEFEGISIYIVWFTVFQIWNLFQDKQLLRNVIYICGIYLTLIICYIITTYYYFWFDFRDILVVVLQLLPISASIINYIVSKRKDLKK